MVSLKRNGFTLGEVLMALMITGIIAILTIPSIVKDVHLKSRMALLKNTIANINNVTEIEFTKSRANSLIDTDIYKDPEAFLQKFDTAPNGEPFAESYKKHSDSKKATGVLIPSNDREGEAAILLKNGVGIGIINNSSNETTYVVIDVTGAKEPNMVGADYFILKIERENGSGHKAGDTSSFANGGDEGQESGPGLKQSCNNGNGAACYRMVELSSFNPKYLE